MMRRGLVGLLVAVVMAFAAGLAMAGPAAAYTDASCLPGGPSASDEQLAARLNPQMSGDKLGGGYLTAYRVSCARAIVAAVKAHGGTQRAADIAMDTAVTETVLENVRVAVDHDSYGLYQQRESIYCVGNVAACIDVDTSTYAFMRKMYQEFPGNAWATQDIGYVAAVVQNPQADYAGRYAYNVGDAQKLVAALWGQSGAPAVYLPYEGGRIVSARSRDGRLEVFAAGPNGISHAWQTGANGSWSDWEQLGGPKNARLAIAPNADGRLELFALNSAVIQHIWQLAPSGKWSAWADFGTGGYDVAAGANLDGRIEVVASNANGVFHKWETSANTWSAWAGTAAGNNGPANSRLQMAVAPDGRLEVFALSGQWFGHLFQTKASGGWGAWENFGTGGHDLTVDLNADGRIEVAASGPQGVFRKWQTSATTWSAWKGTGGPADSELASDRTPDGRIELFAVNGTVLQHSWQTARNGEFASWADFGTGGTDVGSSKNEDGRIELFASNPTGIFHKWQTGFSTWSQWGWLAGSAGPGLN